MLTYSHGVIGFLAYMNGSSSAKKYAVWGSIAPDLLLVAGFILLGLGNIFGSSSLHEIHMTVHSAELPQAITNGLHSIVLITPIAVIVFFIWKFFFPFFAGIILHIGIDFLTHQKWPYNHLYPINAKPVVAIFSYWNIWFMVIEHTILLVLVVVYLRRRYTRTTNFHLVQKEIK